MKSKTSSFAIGALILLLAALPAMAQKVTGGLQGTVADQDGQALPGVTVAIASSALMGQRTEVTDTAGKFRFVLLPPGTYVAEFTLPSYQAVKLENIVVGIEKTITVEVTMQSAFAEEMIITGGAPVVDVTSTTMGNTFNQEMMQNIPTGRGFQALTFLATGAVDGGGLRDTEVAGNPSIMGGSVAENRYVVDEIDTTDPAYGLIGKNVSMEFIQEIQVKTGGYEAEFGGALGGVVNMLTKSGSNEFSGSVFGYYTNRDLTADPTIPETRGDVNILDSEWDVGFGVGGKFIQDKLWYYLAVNPSKQDQLWLKDVYDLDGAYRFQNSFIQGTDRKYLAGKLTWQLNTGNSFTASVVGDPTDRTNTYYSTFYVPASTDIGVLDPSVPTNQFNGSRKQGGINYSANWNSIFSEKLFFEARVGRQASKDQYGPQIDYPNYQDNTTDGKYTNGIGQGSFFGGPGFQQVKDNRTRDQLKAGMSWFVGDNHEVKLGAQYFKSNYDMNHQVVGSSEAFCTPALGMDVENPFWGPDFFGPVWINPATGLPEQLAYNCDSNGDGVLDGIQMPDKIGNRWRLRRTYYYDRNFKNESQGNNKEVALFLQDAWKVTDYLTINLGLRAESTKSTGNLTRINPSQQLKFSLSDTLAPRVGFIWDFAKNGRSRVYGHWGRFYESVPLDINVRGMGNESYDFYYYEYPASGIPNNTTNPGTLFYWQHSAGGSQFDPNLKPPYLEEVVFGGDYEVARDLSVGVKGIYRSLGRVMEDISVDGGTNYFITNPGGEMCNNPGVPGNPAIDPCVFFPRPTRYYKGIELSANKRFSNNWQGYTSLLYSKLEGNYEGLYSRDNQQLDPNITSKYDLPEILIGARGWLPNDRRWQFKTYGSYQFDFGLIGGLSAQYMTGTPVNKLGAQSTYGADERFVVPRGQGGRTPDMYIFDLHLAYPIKLASAQVEFNVDVFNLFDQQKAVEVDQRWSDMDEYEAEGLSVDQQRTNDLWGQPLVYYPPRNIRLGVRFTF